jgi:chromate transport protein ChrA
VTAIVLHAAHRIGTRALKNRVLWVIAAAAFVAIFALGLPFPLIVAGAALVGVAGGRFAPQYFRAGGGHGVPDGLFRSGADRRRHATRGARALSLVGAAARGARRGAAVAPADGPAAPLSAGSTR